MPAGSKVPADWRFITSSSLGGDSFGYHWLAPNQLAIYLLDVCGHGVGAALLANSRPMEGLLFCLPVAAVLVVRLVSVSRGRVGGRLKFRTALLPAVVVLGVTAAFMGYYNWRVTGNALLLPQARYRRDYWDPPLFVWQPVKPAVSSADHPFTGMVEVAGNPAFVGRSWARQVLT